MAYIGKTPVVGNFQICDAISVVNGQAAYTLQVGGANVIPQSANHMIVSLNGVIQKSGSSFTVSGSTITFASNLATGDSIDFVQILGNVLDIGAPSDATVTTAKLGSNAVTSAKMFSGFANGITMADQWRLSTSFTGSANPMTSNLERNDTSGAGFIGTGMTESSGVFSFPSTGIYYVKFHGSFSLNSNTRFIAHKIEVTENNSSYSVDALTYGFISRVDSQETFASVDLDIILDVANISNVKVRFVVEPQTSGTQTIGSSTQDSTYFRFIRLGDT